MALIEIKSAKSSVESDAKDLLNEAVAMDYETVIIFGFKDGEVRVTYSKSRSYLTVVGALEEVKHRLISHSESRA